MKRLKLHPIPARKLRFLGLPLVYLGVAELAIIYFCGWTDKNSLLLLGLFLIVAGIVGYVLLTKAAGKY